MSQFFHIHPDNPQARLIGQAADIIRRGGVAVYPTDSGYALGCHLGDKDALERVRSIRQLDKHHNFTLMCRDLSELGTYANVDNSAFRLLKAHTPGPYTWILKATSEVPRRLMHPKRKTIGLRVPDNAISLALLEALGEPLMSVTLIYADAEEVATDPEEIRSRLGKRVDVIINGGFCGLEATTIIDLADGAPQLVRAGQGDVGAIMGD